MCGAALRSGQQYMKNQCGDGRELIIFKGGRPGTPQLERRGVPGSGSPESQMRELFSELYEERTGAFGALVRFLYVLQVIRSGMLI